MSVTRTTTTRTTIRPRGYYRQGEDGRWVRARETVIHTYPALAAPGHAPARIQDARGLARLLAAVGAPGARPAEEIRRLREERAQRNAPTPPAATLAERAAAFKAARRQAELDGWLEVVSARGGETGIQEERRWLPLEIVDRADGLVLLRCEGWRYYSRREPVRRAALAYVAGTDDNGRWAARVPGRCASVAEGLEALEPAEVTAARAAGRGVLRQGDVYLVELGPRGRSQVTATVVNGSHRWEPVTRSLVHEPRDGGTPHALVTAPAEWAGVRLVPQIDWASSRGWTRD